MYRDEAVALEPTTLDRMAAGRQLLKELQDRKEKARQQLVKQKYLQQAWLVIAHTLNWDKVYAKASITVTHWQSRESVGDRNNQRLYASIEGSTWTIDYLRKLRTSSIECLTKSPRVQTSENAHCFCRGLMQLWYLCIRQRMLSHCRLAVFGLKA